MTISTPFAISKYEVTFEDYDRFTMPTGRVAARGWGRGRRPVIKFTLGDRIRNTALDILESLIEATYTKRRAGHLARVNLGLEKLRSCSDWPCT